VEEKARQLADFFNGELIALTDLPEASQDTISDMGSPTLVGTTDPPESLETPKDDPPLKSRVA